MSVLHLIRSSGQTTPQFSPVVSLRNSPEPSLGPAKEWEIQLENDIKKWTAQIVVAIEHLHINGVICKYVLHVYKERVFMVTQFVFQRLTAA